MGKPFDKEDLSQSGLIFCSCLIFLLDFLDDVFVVSETLAILRIFFCRTGQALHVGMSSDRQPDTYTFFPCQKVNTPVWYAYIIVLSVLSHSP